VLHSRSARRCFATQTNTYGHATSHHTAQTQTPAHRLQILSPPGRYLRAAALHTAQRQMARRKRFPHGGICCGGTCGREDSDHESGGREPRRRQQAVGNRQGWLTRLVGHGGHRGPSEVHGELFGIITLTLHAPLRSGVLSIRY